MPYFFDAWGNCVGRKEDILQAVEAIRDALLLIEEHAEPPHMKGYRFEKEFREMCVFRGIDVRPGDGQHVDVVANGLRVQCKNVTPDEKGVVYIQPGQRTHYEASDFDVLSMSAGGSLYLVPMEFIPKTKGHVSIQMNVNSLRRWVDAWGVFDGLRPPDHQATFFQHVWGSGNVD